MGRYIGSFAYRISAVRKDKQWMPHVAYVYIIFLKGCFSEENVLGKDEGKNIFHSYSCAVSSQMHWVSMEVNTVCVCNAMLQY